MAFVKRGTPGLRIVDDWSGFGQRTTASGTVLLDNVAVDAGQVVDNWRLALTPNIQGAVSQLIQAAIDAGIARGAIDDAIAFVREKSRPWIDANVERASDDLYVIADIGKLKLELHAAGALLRKAGQELDEINAAPIDEHSAARASIAVARAKVLTTEISLLASESCSNWRAAARPWPSSISTATGVTHASIPSTTRCAGNTTQSALGI